MASKHSALWYILISETWGCDDERSEAEAGDVIEPTVQLYGIYDSLEAYAEAVDNFQIIGWAIHEGGLVDVNVAYPPGGLLMPPAQQREHRLQGVQLDDTISGDLRRDLFGEQFDKDMADGTLTPFDVVMRDRDRWHKHIMAQSGLSEPHDDVPTPKEQSFDDFMAELRAYADGGPVTDD